MSFVEAFQDSVHADVDECQDTSLCAENATCLNSVGSFLCSCNMGFTGDGATNCSSKHKRLAVEVC